MIRPRLSPSVGQEHRRKFSRSVRVPVPPDNNALGNQHERIGAKGPEEGGILGLVFGVISLSSAFCVFAPNAPVAE